MYKVVNNHSVIEKDVLMRFEPSLGFDVVIAVINHETKKITPTHGYFAPHRFSNSSVRYANKIGYTFSNV